MSIHRDAVNTKHPSRHKFRHSSIELDTLSESVGAIHTSCLLSRLDVLSVEIQE
jgi:hypothetical protein